MCTHEHIGRVCYAAPREPGPPPRLWPATARSMWCKGPCLGEAPNQPCPKKNVFDSTPCSPAQGHFIAEIAWSNRREPGPQKSVGWPFHGSQAESSFLLLGSLAPTRPMASKHGALQLGGASHPPGHPPNMPIIVSWLHRETVHTMRRSRGIPTCVYLYIVKNKIKTYLLNRWLKIQIISIASLFYIYISNYHVIWTSFIVISRSFHFCNFIFEIKSLFRFVC
jgi:hypothetical protein